MPENVNHVQAHEVLAYNLFNVIMPLQETMQKIVSNNSSCQLHHSRRNARKKLYNSSGTSLISMQRRFLYAIFCTM